MVMPCSRSAGEAVDQQGEVQVIALRAHLPGVHGQRRQLVFIDQLGFIQQPADQRALAVIHAAAGNEAQQVLVLVGLQVVSGCPNLQDR